MSDCATNFIWGAECLTCSVRFSAAKFAMVRDEKATAGVALSKKGRRPMMATARCRAHCLSQRAAHLFCPGAHFRRKRLPPGAGHALRAQRPDAPGRGGPGLHLRHGVWPHFSGLFAPARFVHQFQGGGGQCAAVQPGALFPAGRAPSSGSAPPRPAAPPWSKS